MKMINDSIKCFYEDLRKINGRFAIFLGAGSSYDYGIPTMHEMANILINEIKNESDDSIFDSKSREVLKILLANKIEDNSIEWNIEDFLRYIQNLIHAVDNEHTFDKTSVMISDNEVKKEDLELVENILLKFIASCYELNSPFLRKESDKNIKYLSDFIEFIGEFQNSINIFTTNNDICIEASLIRLSQIGLKEKKCTYNLIDGFSSGLIPTFSATNYNYPPPTNRKLVNIFLWKLHGSIDWTFSNPINDENTNNDYNDDSIIHKRWPSEIIESLFHAKAIATKPSDAIIMIFPTPLKYSQTYSNPYMELYQEFRNIITNVEMLLVVGTSFPDKHINSAFKSFLTKDSSLFYIVDPSIKKTTVQEKFGNLDTIKPIIETGFKDFIDKLITLEMSKDGTIDLEEGTIDYESG